MPKFLLRKWCIEKTELIRAYSRIPYRQEIQMKVKSLDAVCSHIDLLSLRKHCLGKDALERIFFGNIDTCAANIRDILIEEGPSALEAELRCDWARFLLSLDARRPAVVEKLKEHASWLAAKLDTDVEVRTAVKQAGYNERPSIVAESEFGWDFVDRALTVIEGLVDNPRVGGKLINAWWHVRHLPSHKGTFVCSDRPLVRFHGYDRPGAVWLLPLSPHCLFIGANHQNNLRRLLEFGDSQFCKRFNKHCVHQAERFAFSLRVDEKRWIERYLRRSLN